MKVGLRKFRPAFEVFNNCDDSACLNIFLHSLKYIIFHRFTLILHHLRVYYELRTCRAPSWLVSSVGRALHRYRRGHGFESRWGLNFFQALISPLVNNCDSGRGVRTPYRGYIGMCGPKRYGFSAVLVINRVSNLADSGHKWDMVFVL